MLGFLKRERHVEMIDGTREFLGRPRAQGEGAWQIARPAGSLINRLLAPAGLRVTRTAPAPAPCDLRTVVSDPIEGAYHARDKPFLMDVALESSRAFYMMGFACTVEGKHPYIETLLAYGRGDCHAYGDSPLRSFWEYWQPANAAEVLGLPPEQAHLALRNARAIGAVLPWEAYDPDTWTALNIGWIEAEHWEHGASDLPHGYEEVSEAEGEFEFNRLTRVHESIRHNGYQRSDRLGGDISGSVLCSNGVSRILLGEGQHRSAALAALGYEHVPIRLCPFMIHRDDVASWPNVRSGLFTREQALAVFDRIFAGRQPAGCNWTTIWSKQPNDDESR